VTALSAEIQRLPLAQLVPSPFSVRSVWTEAWIAEDGHVYPATADQKRKIQFLAGNVSGYEMKMGIAQRIGTCLRNTVRVVWPLFFGLGLMGFSLPLWALTVDIAEGAMEIPEAQKNQARQDADEFARVFGSIDDPVTREKTALLLLMNVHLRSVEESQDQSHILAILAAYDEINRRFSKDDNPVIRAAVVEALTRKGTLIWEKHGYWKEGKPQQAIVVFDEIGQRFGGNNEDDRVRLQYVRALNKKGRITAQENAELAITIYDDIINRFGNDKNPDIRAAAAQAIFVKAVIVKKLASTKVIYDEANGQFWEIDFSKILDILDHWFEDGYPDTRSDAVALFYRRIATSLFADGIVLRSRADCEKAVFIFDEMDRRFRKVSHEFVASKIFDGMFQKSFCLTKQGKFEGATAIYDEVIRRSERWYEVIGSEFQPIKDNYVARALFLKGRIIEKQDRETFLK
jgi:tetratricopeptide (TPR) repeat protein